MEDNPRVAALVQRGLLKTEDVLSKPYVEAMEKRLRQQEITKEVEGRDPRYRPRTARQAYRPSPARPAGSAADRRRRRTGELHIPLYKMRLPSIKCYTQQCFRNNYNKR